MLIIPIVRMTRMAHLLRVAAQAGFGRKVLMDIWTRRRALRHAAKVAFGSLVIGCGGTQQVNGSDAEADVTSKDVQIDTQDAATADDGPTDAMMMGDGALACTGPVSDDAGDVTEDTFQCCLGVIEGVTGDSGFPVVDASTVTGDPSVDNCCNAVIARVDTNTTDYSAAVAVLPSCCNALGYPTGPACTPWGPPMPPDMVWA
jgi:hypothetical protein